MVKKGRSVPVSGFKDKREMGCVGTEVTTSGRLPGTRTPVQEGGLGVQGL